MASSKQPKRRQFKEVEAKNVCDSASVENNYPMTNYKSLKVVHVSKKQGHSTQTWHLPSASKLGDHCCKVGCHCSFLDCSFSTLLAVSTILLEISGHAAGVRILNLIRSDTVVLCQLRVMGLGTRWVWRRLSDL